MAEKGETKILGIFIICIILISIGLSGCIYPETYSEPNKYPNDLTIVLDKNNCAHLTWMTGIKHVDSYLNYCKINNNGNITYKKKLIKGNFGTSKLLIDSEENLHLISSAFENHHMQLFYLKFNSNGKILFDKTLIGNTSFEVYDPNESNIFDAIIDQMDTIHVVWLEDEDGNGNYLKINKSGNKIFNYSLTNYFGKNNIEYGIPILGIHMILNSSDVIHTLWRNGYNIFNISSFQYGNVNKSISGRFIDIDSKNKIHIHDNKNNYKIIFNNHSIQKIGKIKNISIINNFPAILTSSGEYLYLNDNGSFDSENNLHFTSIKHDIRWASYGHPPQEINYYSLYYNKVDYNGKFIIKNLLIDSDEIKKIDTNLYNYIILITTIIAITIILIIFIKLSMRKKYLKKQK